MDMLHYIHWRGDLTFEERPLNEIDSLLLSVLSYEQFDDILYSNTSLNIQRVCEIFFKKYSEEELKARRTFTYRSYELLKEMAYCPRYKDLELSNYVDEIDEELNLQFSAITYSYKNKFKYIAFRGTDDTIVGWKEDFTMIYKDEVLSQKKAVDYIQNIFKAQKPFSRTKYYIGGHSKGGNLAIYASLNAPKQMRNKIERIDNFDGPGFDLSFWDLHQNQSLNNKITTYIPEASFFGRLFKLEGKTLIFKSNQRGLLQHMPFNWHVDVTKFVYEESFSEGSDKAIHKFNDLMQSYSKNEREELVEGLFSIFKKLEIYTIEDLTEINFNRIINSLKEINNLNSDAKKVIKELLVMIVDITNS